MCSHMHARWPTPSRPFAPIHMTHHFNMTPHLFITVQNNRLTASPPPPPCCLLHLVYEHLSCAKNKMVHITCHGRTRELYGHVSISTIKFMSFIFHAHFFFTKNDK